LALPVAVVFHIGLCQFGLATGPSTPSTGGLAVTSGYASMQAKAQVQATQQSVL